jgi:hypothetical protein
MTMATMHFVRGIAGALIVMAVVHLPSVARAEDWKPTGMFGWLGVGTAYEIEKDHIYWVGEFSGTFFNDKGDGALLHQAAVKCPGYNDVHGTQKKNKAAGYCVLTDRDGDHAYVTWGCDGDTQQCKGTFTWTGGTGKYAKISGTNTYTGFLAVTHPDGKASGYSIWNR